MIALQVLGCIILSAALLAFLESRLGPPKKGHDLSRPSRNTDPAARFRDAEQAAANQEAEARWRKVYDRIPLEDTLAPSDRWPFPKEKDNG